MNKTRLPRVAVLMATYNGAAWIEDQLRSILGSKDVDVHLFISDDNSTDETVVIAQKICGAKITLLAHKPQGGAAQNFIRLILDADWQGFDYVSLSDQDDVWEAHKLSRAIAEIKRLNLDGYSSDITAFWPNGEKDYIRKSQPQRKLDYLFESAGPGNTFVWPLGGASFLRSRLRDVDVNELSRISLHDWLFYAVFRAAGKRWLIDAISGLDYRQHDKNVMGAASGLPAIFKRLELLRNSWYRNQIITVSAITGISNPLVDYINNPKPWRFWVPLRYFRECRRRPLEAAALLLFLLLLPYRKQDRQLIEL